MKRLIIILPAFNESTVIIGVIKAIRTVIPDFKLKTDIVVVNDGSSDDTAKKAAAAGAFVLTHRINRGLGASLGTGLAFAKKVGADLAITMDSDGQHDPADLRQMLKPLISGKADVVIGSRLLNREEEMPFLRRLNNKAFNGLTWILFGILTTDSLSGFRGFSKKAINNIGLKTERMEVSNEFFSEINKHKLKFTEVPIKVIYTPYSIAKGVKPGNVFAIIFRLLLRLVR
ncbi:MAG TPA: glycosyltransferase family 2 protein [Patescibacteria group bacterium]|nr:glycosyltransferase family 2 protein [Patescibacteria group bacterium]